MDRIEISFRSFKWLDLTNPNPETLEQIAVELNLSKKLLLNCLDSDYLPHIETYGTQDNIVHFIVLRLMEPQFRMTADNVQELTTKIALFLSPDRIISIHRLPLSEVVEVERKIRTMEEKEITKFQTLTLFFDQASLGFNRPLTELEHKLEKFEEDLFQNKKIKSLLLDGYYIKRKASAFKKVMKLTIDVVNKVAQNPQCPQGILQQVKDRFERNLFYAEEVHENIQSLLSLHMSIEAQKTNEASFRTNEIMRVLTVLTIFFLPLNFLAGLFGMNFEQIPLLRHPGGFWISLLLMFLTSLGLLLYVLKKGWLSKGILTGARKVETKKTNK